jgi:hypothetical protein
VIPWGHSIALFPFWCLDAKGGEVVLLGSMGICLGICVFFGWDTTLSCVAFMLYPIYPSVFEPCALWSSYFVSRGDLL